MTKREVLPSRPLKRIARDHAYSVVRNAVQAIADLVPTAADERPIPKLGTGKGKVKILDPDWARALTDQEMDAPGANMTT